MEFNQKLFNLQQIEIFLVLNFILLELFKWIIREILNFTLNFKSLKILTFLNN